MKNCRQRSLREQVYRAYVTRASSGEQDNSDLCRRILQLRHEQARLLGAQQLCRGEPCAGRWPPLRTPYSPCASSCVPPRGRRHSRTCRYLRELAQAEGQAEPIQHWDIAFWAERLRERRFDFSDEELRPYFPHERVLDGLFALVQRLFGVTVVAADGQAPTWHEDVRFFRVVDGEANRSPRSITTPTHVPRTNAAGRGWMTACRVAGSKDRLQIPVAHLVCNCTPPVGGKPSLMTFREVETLFHEFGHGLQHMLTTVDYPDAAGINGVEWDAVELPSQFMENWCYHRPTLMGMTAHYETGEPLPDELFEKTLRGPHLSRRAPTCCGS